MQLRHYSAGDSTRRGAAPWVRRDRRMSRRKQSPVGASRLTRPPPCPVCRAPFQSYLRFNVDDVAVGDDAAACPACDAPAEAAGEP